ncbi:hypothetical protein ES708_14732 [subsurface metagenome]
MENDVNCPAVVMGGELAPKLCGGEKCAWWDSEGLCCSVKTMAEFQRLGCVRVANALNRLQETLVRQLDFGAPGVTAGLARLHDSLDARLNDLVYKLDRVIQALG